MPSGNKNKYKGIEQMLQHPDYSGKIVLKDMLPVKQSEVILGFAQPLLDKTDMSNRAVVEKTIQTAIEVWNYCIIIDKACNIETSEHKQVQKMAFAEAARSKIASHISESDYYRLLERKEELYPDNNYFIMEHNIRRNDDDTEFILSVITNEVSDGEFETLISKLAAESEKFQTTPMPSAAAMPYAAAMPNATILLKEMTDALPLYCYSKKRNTKSLAAQEVRLNEKTRLEVDSLFDMGEAGGIMCAIKQPNSDKVLTMSLTGLDFKDNGDIDNKILEYQEARIKWLIQEEQRDMQLERGERIKNFGYSNEPRRATDVSRNAPCPCGSGKKYKRCCGK